MKTLAGEAASVHFSIAAAFFFVCSNMPAMAEIEATQVTAKFVTKLPGKFRVPETPLVRTRDFQ